jgi:hypothetical protein
MAQATLAGRLGSGAGVFQGCLGGRLGGQRGPNFRQEKPRGATPGCQQEH